MNRTEINELGEFGIIDKIKSNFKKKNHQLLLVLEMMRQQLDLEKILYYSSDMLIEKIHFDLSYTPLKHLGYKSV